MAAILLLDKERLKKNIYIYIYIYIYDIEMKENNGTKINES